MKDIDKTDLSGASGGHSPIDGGCFPPFPVPDYPQIPTGPITWPLPEPGLPDQFTGI